MGDYKYYLGVDIAEVINRGFWSSMVSDVLLVVSPVKASKSLCVESLMLNLSGLKVHQSSIIYNNLSLHHLSIVIC